MPSIFRPALLALCALLASAFLFSARATPGAATPGARVVVATLCVAEQAPERVEAAFTTPLEKLLLGLPGVEMINSNTSYGSVALEIHFKGGASEDDAASVTLALDRSDAGFLSRSVRLEAPRADGFSLHRNGCAS
jgi:Cu/Ag efflux pump CusA